MHNRGRNASLMDLCFLEPCVFCLLESVSVVKMLVWLSVNKAWCIKHLMVFFLSAWSCFRANWSRVCTKCRGAQCAAPLGNLRPATIQCWESLSLLWITIWLLTPLLSSDVALSQRCLVGNVLPENWGTAVFITGERWLREDVVEQGSESIKCHPTKGSAKGNLTSGTKEVTQPVKWICFRLTACRQTAEKTFENFLCFHFLTLNPVFIFQF